MDSTPPAMSNACSNRCSSVPKCAVYTILVAHLRKRCAVPELERKMTLSTADDTVVAAAFPLCGKGRPLYVKNVRLTDFLLVQNTYSLCFGPVETFRNLEQVYKYFLA